MHIISAQGLMFAAIYCALVGLWVVAVALVVGAGFIVAEVIK